MSNYLNSKEEITNYIKARTPLIIIDSSERERVERMLNEIRSELCIEIYYYTDSKQVMQIGSANSAVDTDNDPLSYMSMLFRKKRGTIFVFGDVKKISEDTMYSREIINILYLAKESNSTLILITSDEVLQRITRFGMITKLDLPNLDERQRQIVHFTEMYAGRFTVEWDVNAILKAATLLRGFTEIQIENILSNEIISQHGLFKDNIYNLTSQKDKLYTAVSSISPVRVDRNMKVSGMKRLSDWLIDKKKIFFAADHDLEKYGLDVPKGILLSGVPGCGKSYSAKMIAKEWELPLYRFDIGSIYDKWMGESERKMREALNFIDNVSPCILWIDEIEKVLAVSDGGNDTSQRILGQFLFWLQESRSRVFLVATANDISRLPSELFRKGRFSEIFFVDLPTKTERMAAIEQYTEKCLHIRFNENQMDELITLSEGFSFSEIEYAIKEIAQILFIYGSSSLKMDSVRSIFSGIIPIEKRDPETVNRIRLWGAERAVPAN